MKALKTQEGDTAAVVDVPTPTVRPGYLLCKTKAVALNPTDWKHIQYGMGGVGATLGCDFAGEVVEADPGVTRSFKKGDRVCGFTHGGNSVQPEDGCFGEYALVKGDTSMHIPDYMSFEDAATMPVAIITVGQGMYQQMKLPWPGKGSGNGQSLLVYGGSSGTGMMAIQYAKLSGFEVYTTCSPRNFDLVKSLGATKAYDYKSPTCSEDIRRDTENKLFFAFDCISEGSSPGICAAALSSASKTSSGEPLKYGCILAVSDKDFPRIDVSKTYSLGYTMTGEKVVKGSRVFEANKEDFNFGKEWCTFSEGLLAEKKIKPHRASVRDGGLEKIQDGLEDVKTGRNSGVKIVYPIA